ncbi:hypothetical protein ACHAXT_003393 [Thalassiosira profunda]
MVRTRRLHWFGGRSLSSAPSALRKNRGGDHANDRPGRGDDKEGSGKPWRRAVGAALLLGAASTSLVAAVSLLKRRRAVGSTPKSFLTAVPSLFLAVASGLLLRAAATSTAQVGGGNALTVGIMVACGFLISLLMSRERSKSDLARDEAEETSTVADEEDCLSCDSCGLERDIFLPPSSVLLGSQEGLSEGAIDTICVDGEPMSNGRRAILFLHGGILGAATTTPCTQDGTFAIVGIAAILHSVYLGVQDRSTTDENNEHLAGSLLLDAFYASLLSVGGALAALAIPHTIATALLTIAAGVYLQVALGMIVPGLKQRINSSDFLDAEPSLHGEAKQKISHMSARASRLSISRFHRIQALAENDLPGHCVPCSETTPLQRKASSDSQPIPVTERPVEVDPEYTGLMKRYNAATWGMYARIQEAREIRTRCGVCMESMEEGDAAVLTFTEELEKETGVTDEERRLLAICPSPLYTEPEASECINGAKPAKGGFLVAHKNCYETMEEPKCPQKKALREETVFQLDW